MSSGPTTVIVADDHPLLRKGVVDILREDSAIRVVGEAPDGEAALKLIRDHTPNIAILDVEMPKMTGLAVAAAVQADALPVLVVLVTMHGGQETLQQALALGVKGFVSKESAADDILACIHLVANGRTYLSASFERGSTTPAAPGGAKAATPGMASLTAAERNVLRRIAKSLSTKDIAEQLGVSPKTVENQRASICTKLGVKGNNALVRFAMDHAEELKAL